jgi:PadR family transcriptional regulator PadR
MDINSWQAQLRKGAAELVVLSLLTEGELYGVELLDAAGGSGGVLSDGTLYPLLTRLEREGKLEARWVMAEDAKIPRKYYRLTAEGEALVARMQAVWHDFSAFVTGAIRERGYGRRTSGAGREIPSLAR